MGASPGNDKDLVASGLEPASRALPGTSAVNSLHIAEMRHHVPTPRIAD